MVWFLWIYHGKLEVSLLGLWLLYAGGIILGCKIGSIYGNMLGFILETADEINFGLDEQNGLGFLIGTSEEFRYDLLNGISLGW